MLPTLITSAESLQSVVPETVKVTLSIINSHDNKHIAKTELPQTVKKPHQCYVLKPGGRQAEKACLGRGKGDVYSVQYNLQL